MLNLRSGALLLAAAALLATAGRAVGTDPFAIESLPQIAPPVEDPMLVVVDLASQRLVAYRGGEAIASSPVSTGRPGFGTPHGVFTILQKRSFHRSNLYSDAPMPFMQRLTWGGVALHAGVLPAIPLRMAASGCRTISLGSSSRRRGPE